MRSEVLWKMVIGGVILISLVFLAGAIALGKVEEKTSYGLTPILTILGKFVLDFSEWAYRGAGRRKDEPDKEE